MVQRPTVTVIIPTYNRADLVTRAIDSLLRQTQVPDEILVIDDGSTDNTPEVLARYGPPVKVITQPNRGRSAARNVGLQHAQGDLISFLDSDDWLPETSIEKRARWLETHPECQAVYSDVQLVTPAGHLLELYSHQYPVYRPSGMILSELALHCFILINSAMHHKTQPSPLLFDKTCEPAEDYDYWLRLAARYSFAYLDDPLACCQIAEEARNAGLWGFQNYSSAVNLKEAKESEIVVQRRVFNMPEFHQMSGREQAKIYASHGVKNAMFGDYDTARHCFWTAIRRAPFYPLGYVLFTASLFGKRSFEPVILARRRLSLWRANRHTAADSKD